MIVELFPLDNSDEISMVERGCHLDTKAGTNFFSFEHKLVETWKKQKERKKPTKKGYTTDRKEERGQTIYHSQSRISGLFILQVE